MPVELPLKPRQREPAGKKVKSTSSNAGVTGGKKGKASNGLAAVARAEMQKEARAQSERNRTVLLILPSGKRRFMKLSEYNAM